jgi:predicted CXXCH cytochrome family protein
MNGHHPVSIPYAGQTNYNGTLTSKAKADSSLGNYWSVTNSGCNTASGWCTTATVGDGVNGSYINLLPNTVGGGAPLGVECTTCHEPHNQTGYTYLLRIQNTTASGLCRSCHNK